MSDSVEQDARADAVKPPATPWLTPYLCVVDAAASQAFYERAFGFVARDSVAEDGVTTHVEMTYRGELIIMFAPEGAYGSTARTPRSAGTEAPHLFYLYVDDVDTCHAHAVEAGARSLMAPADQFWGDRFCQIEDLDGYRWGIARRRAAEVSP